jgi:class 3 adenylate cyclase
LCCGPMLALPEDERLGLDTLHRQMRVLYNLVCAVAPQYGGHVQPPAGTYVLAVFGAQVAEEDHAQRAVLTALLLQQRLATPRSAHEMPGMETLTVRMGLHTGTLAVGGIG